MAPLVNFVLFGLVATLSTSVQAGQLRSDIKRADLDIDCPTCGNEPAHPSPHPWEDWSMASSATSSSPVVPTPFPVPTYGGVNSTSVASVETPCTGTNTFTTSTVNASTTAPACTVSPWWNDPAISAEIASWITQFPPIPDNATVQFSTFSFASNSTQTMGNTTSSTTASTSYLTTTTSHSSTISSAPITTPILPSSLRDFTVLATDDNGDVYSEVFSGGVMVSSTLVSSRLLPTLGPSGPWTFGSSGVSLVSKTTSTPPISVGSGAHPTLTSMTRSYSEVSIFTCDGVAAFDSASCTDSWGLQTVSTTVPSADEQTSYCAHWTAFTTTTSPAMAGVLNCATPVSGKATSTVATAWNSGLPWSPFQLDTGPISKFCQSLVDRNIVFYQGIAITAASSSGLVSPGECDLFPSHGDSKFDYELTIGLAFDFNGCASPTGTPFVNGISMKDYGEQKCISTFWNHLNDKCKFSDSDAKKRGLGQWTRVGGIYWADCMRWTIIAARSDLSPPDNVDGNLQ
ncbi:hypothetical protein CLAIMM_09604 [Cladophialophora immunda]|nr:hypothetical protein CLAIMM_09604 [Cladophialophora immunda]